MAAPDWATLESEIPTLLAALMGIPCQFRDAPAKMQQGAHAFVDLLAPTALGVDDVRYADVGAPATGIAATVVGQREVTLQVTVWSPSQSLAQAARVYLERLRTRLRWPSTKETLRGLGLALVRTEAVVDVDPVEDGRVRSVATLDLRVAYGASETDATEPYIEDAHVSSTYEDAAGNPVGTALQMNLNPTDPTP